MADIIHRIGIKAPATKVYEAVATAQGVAGWWTRDTTGIGRRSAARSTSRFRHKDGKEIGQMDFEMTTARPRPGSALALPRRDRRNGSGPTSTFQLTQDGDMTIADLRAPELEGAGRVHGALQHEVGGVPAESAGAGRDRDREAVAGGPEDRQLELRRAEGAALYSAAPAALGAGPGSCSPTGRPAPRPASGRASPHQPGPRRYIALRRP